MNGLEVIRVALEASIAAQLALFAAFLFATSDWRRPTGFFLSLICVTVIIIVALNFATGAGVPGELRVGAYFAELALGPLVIGLVARAGENGPPIRRGDWLLGVTPILAGTIALGSAWRLAPDMAALCLWAAALASAGVIFWNRRRSLAETGGHSLVLGTISLGAAACLIRIWMMLDAERGASSYRDGVAYICILVACVIFASRMLWTALRQPQVFARPKRRISGEKTLLGRLEAAFMNAIEDDKLYLQPNLRLLDVANRLQASPKQVSQLIATRFGTNFSAYLNGKRAEFAAASLETSDKPITTIMYDSGFGSKSAFQREFLRRFSMTPSEFRERRRLNANCGGPESEAAPSTESRC